MPPWWLDALAAFANRWGWQPSELWALDAEDIITWAECLNRIDKRG